MISLILSFHPLNGRVLMRNFKNKMAKDMPRTHSVDEIK